MNNRERFQNEIKPYVEEGLLREVYSTKDFTVTCVVNSAYCLFLHNIVDKNTNLTLAVHFRASEFEIFMEEPTMRNFKYFNYACQMRGEKRALYFTPQLAEKFRELKRKLDAENKIEVDLELERRLVEEAKKKYEKTGLLSKLFGFK